MTLTTQTKDPPLRDAAQTEEQRYEARLASAKAKGWRRFFEPNYNVNYSARLFSPHYENVWDREQKGQPTQRWMDSLGSRMGIRVFSRGLMGSGIMLLGDHMLDHYVPASAMTAAMKANQSLTNKALNGIAGVYDFTLSKPAGVLFGHEPRFRTHRQFGNNGTFGRSYGEEAVAISLNFAMGSIGDAWGRNLAGIFDPNVKKSWMHDGQFHPLEFAGATLKSGARILSFNQMEDWAAAIPYVFQMKLQRHAFDKMRPGARLMLDHGFNGGGLRIDRDGKAIGDYALPGALDLQLRFMGYNVYTLIFRDAYNHVKYSLEHRHDKEKPVHERGFFEEAAKYVVKSAIKANIYMAPAVPFFWMFRTAHGMLDQPRIYSGIGDDGQKLEGVAWVNGEDGAKGTSPYRYHDRYSPPGSTIRVGMTPNDPRGFSLQSEAAQHLLDSSSKVFAPKENYGWFARTLQPVAKLQGAIGNRLATGITDQFVAKPQSAIENSNSEFWRTRANVHRQSQRFVGNAMAYTPYMIAKYETANQWDTPQMDAAIYRALDGVTHGKWSEIKAGFNDVGHVMRRLPVSVETERQTREPRGLVNSTQQARDADDRRDGRVEKSFAERQLENKLARLRREREGNDPDTGIEIRDGAAPGQTVSTRDTTGKADYKVSLMTPERPTGATLH